MEPELIIQSPYKTKVKLVVIDTDINSDIAGEFNIRSIPTVILFKNGTEVAKFTGAIPKSKVEEFLDKNI